MKKIILFIALCLVAGTVVCNAQSNEKRAKKEAKRLMKDEGFQPSPGAQPIEVQLLEQYNKRDERVDGEPKYIMATAVAVGQNYNSAKLSARESARQQIAGDISAEFQQLIEDATGNMSLDPEEAASANEIKSKAKTLVSQSMGRMITITEMYRKLPNKNTEVSVTIAYDYNNVKAKAKNAIREQLTKDCENLGKKLDEKLGW